MKILMKMNLDIILLYVFIAPPSRIIIDFWKYVGRHTRAKLYYENLIHYCAVYDKLDDALRNSYERTGRFPHGIVFFMLWLVELVVTGLTLKLTGVI